MYEETQLDDWQQVAERLLAALGDVVAERGSPVWLRLFENPGTGSGRSLEMGDEPGLLIGWTAPPRYVAVGIVATGQARACAEGGGSLSLRPDGAHVRMCCVVARSGEVGWTLEGPAGRTWSQAPTEGKMLDALKRCFGLPTPPPEVTAAELHAAAWLSSVLDHAIKAPTRLTWSEVARMHPLARLLSGDLAGRDPAPETDDLATLVHIAANAWSWPEIRSQACAGNLGALIDSELAAWMDDGMFSRWLIAGVPSLDQLLAALNPHLVPSALKRLVSVLP
jgi:hypothetical protein